VGGFIIEGVHKNSLGLRPKEIFIVQTFNDKTSMLSNVLTITNISMLKHRNIYRQDITQHAG